MGKFRAIHPISSDKFTFRDNVFTCEASDLKGLYIGQIYEDAIDIGFAMRSVKTNNVSYFYWSHEVKDADGDILYSVFKACDRKLAHVSVKIFND